jgi:cytidylate kinase
MFLTGPAGSGKSTAMKVAQQFCYEFCIAVGVMWSDKTFIFTAYTGSAASLFGGVTISKTAFLNQRKQLSVDDRNE